MKPAFLASLLAVAAAAHAGTGSSEIAAGRKALEQGQPEIARQHFLAVQSTAPDERFVALIGLGRADLWLGDYSDAAGAFREASSLAQGPADKQAADAGLARALDALEYYREANALAAPIAKGQLEPTIEVLRSDLALGWEDKSVPYLQAMPAVDPESRSGREYLWLKSDADFRLSDRLGGEFAYSHDSDNLTVWGYGGSATFPGAPGGDYFNAFRITGRSWLVDDGTTTDHVNTLLAGSSLRLGDWQHLDVDAGVVTVRGRGFFEGTMDWNLQFDDRYGVMASASRAPILTTTALGDELFSSSYSLGASLRPLDHLYILPAYVHQDFTDGNHRDGAALRLVLSPYDIGDTPTAVGGQIFAREYNSSQPSHGIYFNPEAYSQEQFDLIVIHRLSSNWRLRGVFGVGNQTINGASSISYDLQLSVTGRLPGNGRLEGKFERNSFASAVGGGSDYWSNTVTLSLTYPVDF
jgi:hypothetical protein